VTKKARQTLSLLIMTLLLITVTKSIIACAVPPKEHFFMMAYLRPLKVKKFPTHSLVLRIKPLDINYAYDKEKMVYRYSQFEFEYYHYQLWAVRPQKMISDLLRRYLTESEVVSRIVTKFTERTPDYELSGEVLAVEELDSGDSWFAHLALSLHMTAYGSDKVVWSYEFDDKKPVHNKAPVYVVKALSEIFEKHARQIAENLDEFFNKAKGKNQ